MFMHTMLNLTAKRRRSGLASLQKLLCRAAMSFHVQDVDGMKVKISCR